MMKAKQMMGLAFLLMLAGGHWACRGKPSGKERPAGQEKSLPDGWMEVKQPGFSIREEPGMESPAIRRLEPGGRALSLNEQSTLSSRLELEGKFFEEPWLLARLEDGTEGWIYALAFVDNLEDEKGLPLPVRLRSLFGASLAERIVLYKEAFEQAHTAGMVVQAMEMGAELRDSLVQALALRAFESERPEGLFWLKDAIPGFVPYLRDDGLGYYLFMDYHPYLARAKATQGIEDDALIELCLMAYPEDSIEYFYPAWKFQAGEKEVHSLLGRGLHFRFLKKLDQLQQYEDLLAGWIGRFRLLLLNDMLGANVTYWESREKATAELDEVLQGEFRVLGPEGQAALKARRLQFETPEKYAIRFNYRTGIYDH